MANDRIGDYKLISRLGSGGTGTVFKAFQEKLGRTVALKVLHPGYGRNASLVKRFRREIQVSAGLNHPYLVKVYDAGQENEHHYFSMEFVEGVPLRDKVKGGQKLPLKDAIKIAMQMSEALAYFHSKGLIHRDIKPENMMIDAGGNVKLMDFGIVKVTDSTVITQEGSTLGTPRYMSPEMVMGEQQDLRSDIFQLGVVLYEMVTGKCPFDGPTISAIATQITENQPPSPSLLADQMPPALEAVVLKCLEKEPVNRFLNADELATALKQAELASISGAGRAARGDGRPPRVATFRMTPGIVPAVEGNNTVIELPQNLTDLPNFVGQSFRSVKMTFDEQPGLRKSLVLAPIAFILGLAIIYMWAGDRGQAIIGPVTVVEGMTGIRAQWQTRKPGPTEIEVVDTDGVPRRFADHRQPSVTDHSISISQMLKRGAEYSVRVVHADGSRSEPVKVVLPTVDKLLAGEPLITPKGPGSVEISLRTHARAQARLHGKRGESPLVVELSKGWSLEHNAVLDKIAPEEQLTDLMLVVEGVDERAELPLPPIMGPVKMAAALRSTLGSMKDTDLEQIAKRLYSEMFLRKKLPDENARDLARAKGAEAAKSSLKAWLREKKLEPLMGSLKILSPWLFGRENADLDGQIDSYKALERLTDLEHLGHELAHAQILDVPMQVLYRSFVQVDHVAEPGAMPLIIDNSQKDRVMQYMTRRYRQANEGVFVQSDGNGRYTQGKIDGVDLSPVSTKFEGGTEDSFAVSPDELSAAERARFVFQIANMRADVYLDVRLNDRLALRIRSDPTKVQEYDMQSMFYDSATIGARSAHVAVTLPAKLLLPGRNKLQVSAETIPGVGPVMGASLLRVWFRTEAKNP